MGKRTFKHMSPEVRREVLRLAAQGKSHREIGEIVGYASSAICYRLKPFGGVIRQELWWCPGPTRLSLDERIEIEVGLKQGCSMRAISRRINRSASTVTREVKANGGCSRYRAGPAHRRAGQNARRPKQTKLVKDPQLADQVAQYLRMLWSPEQISRRLAEESEGDQNKQISHETIYKSLYVQGRGALRKELALCLRTGRARRVSRRRIEKRGQINDMIPISERPAEADDRAVPGHWEGDLILGEQGRSAIGTLVERSTRYVMLFPVEGAGKAEDVRQKMTAIVQKLPQSIVRSIAWDRGREMAQHVQFTIDTGIEVYFCDPYSPWQRGSNENTNGLLRQYFPKGTDLSHYSQEELDAAADSLNGRPRQTLDWRTPAEALAEFVAQTG